MHSANQEDKTIKLLEKSKVPYISLFDKTFSNSSDIHPRLKRWLPSFSVNRVKNFIDGSYKKYLKLDQAELKKQWLDHQAIYFLKFFSESFPEDEAKKYFIQTEATRPTFLAQAVLLQDGELGRQGIVRLGKGADDETWIHARFEEFINMEFMETIQALCGDIKYDMSLDDCIDEEFLPQKYSFEIMEDSIIQMSVPEGRIVIFPIKY